ncbi:hypothetical protein RUM43_000068 [Polyplax serrata]|uniref:Protein SMG5 n=1 Tax=Polyplax serrata TaxID=468196 RepID=A0AAN8SG15_POLSC
MKKSYIPISDVSNEKSELTRRIYRSLTEVVRQLDDVRGRSQTVSNLFLPGLALLKTKLHDLCYKLILTDPLGHGKKGEELLWRKGYHDIFITAKQLRKNNMWSFEDVIHVQGLLMSGIGHYQHYLFKLQTDYKLDFQGLVDFPLTTCALGLAKVGETVSTQRVPDKNLTEWAKESCYRCLIYLGDLNRYLLDIYPYWDSGTAERYYIQAANMNIRCGRPHNQLGTLAGSKNYNLDAAYHYIRCIIRPEPFQGAEGNLQKALEKNAEFMQLEPFLPHTLPAVQKLVMRFLFFFDVWYFDNTMDNGLHSSYCHEMLQELQFCLQEESKNSLPFDLNETEISNITPFGNRSLENPDHLSSDMVLKIIILLLICVEKQQKRDFSQSSVVMAVSLAVLSQLLQHVIEKLQQFFSRYTSDTLGQESQKSSSPCDSQQFPLRHNEKYKKKNKGDNIENGNLNKKNGKGLIKENKNFIETENCSNGDLFDEIVNETENTKQFTKKKNRLKRRKRIRPVSSCESDLSDSDITLNDSSSGEDCFSGDSDSEVISSDSEDLDETLLIIDQKIKEKKFKGDRKGDEITSEVKKSNNEEEEEGVKLVLEPNSPLIGAKFKNELAVNGVNDKNGTKSSNEKDKMKSLFTVHNGIDEEDMKQQENNRGDFTAVESVRTSDTPIGNKFSSNITNESSDLDKASPSSELHANLYNLRHVDMKKFLHFLSQQGILRSIKLYCDWFQTDSETVKACCKKWNVLKKNGSNSIPLSEDIMTRGLPMLQGGRTKLEWDYHIKNRVNILEENLLRLTRLTEFGHYLSKMEGTGIFYNKRNKMFYMVGQNGKVANSAHEMENKEQVTNATRKGQLMKNMGQLWLKAEVRDLESRVRRRAGNFSPYLVVDSEALIEHIVLVKQLVGSRQFIVIIPAVVLSHLDECKRDSGRARETIRWLESQFQHGNRSLRAQKSQERISLPLIKYPKKKDKEAWNFFQIVECCHYFSKQSEFQSSQSNLLVTLLTGQREFSFVGDCKKEDLGKDYSPLGVAKNFGGIVNCLSGDEGVGTSTEENKSYRCQLLEKLLVLSGPGVRIECRP